MPWKTGQVGTFANKAITVDETIGNGNGSNLNFTYQLSKYSLFRETLVIKYTVGSTAYTASCTSGGVISGTHIASGSCTEEGYISLTFSTAPDNATPVYADSYTAKGILQCVLDFVCGEKSSENLGTGDGSTVVFSTTLSNTPIAYGQCRIRYKIAGVVYDVWDNGEGYFEGTKIVKADSTINNSTGEVSIKFSEAIDNAYVMIVDYCVSSIDGRDWMILHETTTKTALNAEAFSGQLLKQLILKNSGVSYKDMFVVGLREWQYVSNQSWAWNLNLYNKWDLVYETNGTWNCNSTWAGGNSYDTIYNNYTQKPSIYFKDDLMKYWVISNKRRIIVICRVTNTVYTSCYLGGIKRISNSQQYPVPGFAIGTWYGNVNFSSTSLKSIFTVSVGNSQFKSFGVSPNGDWLSASAGSNLDDGQTFTNTGTLKANSDGSVSLFPCFLMDLTYNPDILIGQLDGVYNCLCDSLSVEDIIQEDSVDHLVVQDVYRTSYSDYFAVALE